MCATFTETKCKIYVDIYL